jgi:hypothetical protein
MSKHKVILWGPGGVGEYVLRDLTGQPELERPPARYGLTRSH